MFDSNTLLIVADYEESFEEDLMFAEYNAVNAIDVDVNSRFIVSGHENGLARLWFYGRSVVAG